MFQAFDYFDPFVCLKTYCNPQTTRPSCGLIEQNVQFPEDSWGKRRLFLWLLYDKFSCGVVEVSILCRFFSGTPEGLSAVAALHRHDAARPLAGHSARCRCRRVAQGLAQVTKVSACSHAGGVQQWSGTCAFFEMSQRGHLVDDLALSWFHFLCKKSLLERQSIHRV